MIQQTKDLRAQIEADKVVLEEQERIAADREDEAARIKAQAEETIVTLEATLEQLDAEAQELLAKEQEEQRAAEGRCGSCPGQADVRLQQRVGGRGHSLAGLGGGLRALAHRLPLCVGRGGA